MKNSIPAVYAVPWAFLGLYCDISIGTGWSLLAYAVSLAIPVLTGWYLGRQGHIQLALTGNLLSAACSFFFTLLLRTDHWNAYYKPFGALGLVMILWLVSFLLQALFWRHFRKDTLTAALIWLSAVLLLLSPQLCMFLALI